MKTLLKAIVARTPLYGPLRTWVARREHARQFSEWEATGCRGLPPHLVKQRTLRRFAKDHGLRVLVETGTYLGDMVEAMKHDFDQIYSIELSRELHESAKRRFKAEKNVELIYGDSATELGSLVGRIDQPALFWLDGHYSGGETARGDKDTPVLEELDLILKTRDHRHVIIVDDARCFGRDPGYPTLEELTDFVRARRPDAQITVEDDSVRVTSSSPIG